MSLAVSALLAVQTSKGLTILPLGSVPASVGSSMTALLVPASSASLSVPLARIILLVFPVLRIAIWVQIAVVTV